MTRLLVLVLACGALLISTAAQHDYHSLSELYKTAIKLAVENAHQSTRQHMNFYTQWKDPKISSDYIEIEFLLKATNCSKSAVPDHRDDCVFMTNRPFINCRVCSKRSRNDLKDPSIDCVPHRKVDKPFINCRVRSKRSGNDLKDPSIDCVPHRKVDEVKRKKMCRGILGEYTVLAVKDAEKAEIDCPGCY